ncbi:MAG TPA: hypothetical protein VEY08_15935 [Chloroflexia bacterium]|nr:hypothetical protein [Chloroflexia bacterium]
MRQQVLRQLRLLATLMLVLLLVLVGTASALIAYSMVTRTAVVVGFNDFDLGIEPPDPIGVAYLGARALSAPYRAPDEECYEYDNKAIMVGRVYFGMLSCTSWQPDTDVVPWSPVTPSPAPVPTNTNVPT